MNDLCKALLLGASGGNCLGVEPLNLITLRSADGTEDIFYAERYGASIGTSVLATSSQIDEIRTDNVFPRARVRHMDIRLFFRGPQARFAELIITRANFNELFIPEQEGTGRRLRPLNEIPREYFLDSHHPLDGDYLHITTKFDAHILNSPVAGECSINPLSDTIYNPQRGDQVGYYNSDFRPHGVGNLYAMHGESLRVRQIYVDTSRVEVYVDTNCVGDDTIAAGSERAYAYSLANGIRRFMLEAATATPAGFPTSANTSWERACT